MKMADMEDLTAKNEAHFKLVMGFFMFLVLCLCISVWGGSGKRCF